MQGRYYDSMVSHTTIVFTRYIVLAWQHRCSSDDRTLGGITANLFGPKIDCVYCPQTDENTDQIYRAYMAPRDRNCPHHHVVPN